MAKVGSALHIYCISFGLYDSYDAAMTEYQALIDESPMHDMQELIDELECAWPTIKADYELQKALE